MVCVTGTDGKLFPLGGNMRLKAIQHLGMKEIPDTWITMADEWTEEQRREFIIKDNLPGGEWDWDTLVNEWDQDKLEEWGLEMPNFESSEVDISDKITESFKIEISCNDESEQEKTYNYLIEKGYNCRLLSL
jgi:hypothetical protein